MFGPGHPIQLLSQDFANPYTSVRPIPLLFHSGKLAEEVIIRKMGHKLDAVIQPSQYAYKDGVSTTDALFQYSVFSIICPE